MCKLVKNSIRDGPVASILLGSPGCLLACKAFAIGISETESTGDKSGEIHVNEVSELLRQMVHCLADQGLPAHAIKRYRSKCFNDVVLKINFS